MYIGRVVVTTYSIHNLPQAGCDEKEVIYIYSQVPRAGTIPMIPTERAPYLCVRRQDVGTGVLSVD